METSDKHCQTFTVKKEKIDVLTSDYAVMYDESVPVLNAREIESPASSDGEEVVRAAMAKFNPPVRHTARHDFDSESETDTEQDNFLDNLSMDEQVRFGAFL